MPEAEYKLGIKYTKDKPYFSLTGELWGVFRDNFEENDSVITAPYCI